MLTVADGAISCELPNSRVYWALALTSSRIYPELAKQLLVAALRTAIQRARRDAAEAPVIYLSPQGDRFDQDKARQLAGLERIILVARQHWFILVGAIVLEIIIILVLVGLTILAGFYWKIDPLPNINPSNLLLFLFNDTPFLAEMK